MWSLVSLQTVAGSNSIPTATVTLEREGTPVTDAAIGDGPVDAVYSAIQRITGVHLELKEYQLRAITGGKEAQGEVTIEVTFEGRPIRARGVSTDIVEAYGRAYVAAVNRALTIKNGQHEKPAQP